MSGVVLGNVNASLSICLTALLCLSKVRVGMATSENSNTTRMHPNKVNKSEMPCVKTAQTHALQTDFPNLLQATFEAQSLK